MSLKTAISVIVRKVPALIVAVLFLLAMPALWNGALAADPAMPEDRGLINRIDYNNEVVINDILFRLNSKTRYYSSHGNKIRSSEFVEGTVVAYSLTADRRIVLTLWKTE